MLAQRLYAGGLIGLGAAAVGIGTGIFLAGPAAVAEFCASAIGLPPGAGDALAAPNADNEMRFYAVLWVAFGVIAIRAARSLPASLAASHLLLGLFFAGGAGRALSMSTMGAPHPLFIILMWIELLASPALYLLSLQIKRAGER
ncbi:MAG: DUF4345 domain-containing protein [Parvularculaceae bacterium]